MGMDGRSYQLSAMVAMAAQNANRAAFAGSAQLRIADFRLPIAELKQTLAACGRRLAPSGWPSLLRVRNNKRTRGCGGSQAAWLG